MATPPFKVKAVYDYNSPHEEDLSFPNGQIITVTGEEDADWYTGEYTDNNGNKKEGIFPRNFVEKYEPAPPPRPVRSARPKTEQAQEPTSPARATAEEPIELHSEEALPGSPSASVSEQPHVQPPSSPPAAQTPKPVAVPEPPRSPEAAPTADTTKAVVKPPPSTSSKPPPPAVNDKPSGSSFKDRIAAFNRQAAAPLAPPKPGIPAGSSGFIKKPFVAPPPRKDAYIPPPREPVPQKIYRREEDPEIAKERTEESEHRDIPSSTAPSNTDAEETVKPQSLKDRIALLQKQQLEQQARQAEAIHKKEKPKRPVKQRTESHDELKATDDVEETLDNGETPPRRSTDAASEETATGRRPSRPRASRELSRSSEAAIMHEDTRSDANDADQSGAGETTEDAEENSTGRDDSDVQQREMQQQHPPAVRKAEPEVGEENDTTEDEEEEEDVDPEVKRRMELRERMAKMSGGMGMYGMFGPPGGLPAASGAPKKKKQPIAGKKASEEHEEEASPVSYHAPVPIMPIPGMARMKPPEPAEEVSVEKEDEGKVDITSERPAEEVPDVEDVKPEDHPPTEQRRLAPPVPQQERPPPVPSAGPVAAERGPPPVPENRPAPPPPPTDLGQDEAAPEEPRAPSPSAGSISDDEMSLHARKHLSLQTPTDESGPELPPPSQARRVPPVPIRPLESPRLPTGGDPSSPTSPASRRPPPIPGAGPMIPPPTQARAPPPPPPTGAPPSRRATGLATSPSSRKLTGDSDEEVTEYDGDYDTDMAPGDSHKDALKAHGDQSEAESTTADDTPIRTPELTPSQPPSLPPQPPPLQRAVPPPPPGAPPKATRQSMDMPRAAPPPVPPPRDVGSEQAGEDEYDPFRYNSPVHGVSKTISPRTERQAFTYPDEGEEESPVQPPPQPRAMAHPPPPPPSQYAAPLHERPAPPPPPPESSRPPAPPAGRPPARQSTDIQRTPTGTRKSMDQARQSGDRGFIATDVDLGENSNWWTQRKMPPPIFQNRKDVLYEVEESNMTENGVHMVNKEVYVLFQDYSQTIINARFNTRDPSDVSLEQRHEGPPPRLRQDQLEDAHMRFGQRISEAASARQNAVVGDGTAQGLVLELVKPLHGALFPVGNRAYGALVYANLANASVQQYDEIRPGDIITLRNTKFQGHKGTMHQKYSMDVGKPDHVGVVVDWDGTKKKIRAWEQGRESRKVKMESYKMGDLKSGEVKVWRVMGRSWVGWDES